MLPDFTFSEGNVILSKSQKVWILMMAITLQFKNVIPDLVNLQVNTHNEFTFLMPCVP